MTKLIDQPTWTPTRKVQLGAVGGLPSAMILASLLERLFGLQLSPEFLALMSGLIPLIVAYFSKERAKPTP